MENKDSGGATNTSPQANNANENSGNEASGGGGATAAAASNVSNQNPKGNQATDQVANSSQAQNSMPQSAAHGESKNSHRNPKENPKETPTNLNGSGDAGRGENQAQAAGTVSNERPSNGERHTKASNANHHGHGRGHGHRGNSLLAQNRRGASPNHGNTRGTSPNQRSASVSPNQRNHSLQREHREAARERERDREANGNRRSESCNSIPETLQVPVSANARCSANGASNIVTAAVPDLPLLHGNIAQPPQGAPYNWQATKSTVKERLGFMFNSEVMSDVHFVVGKGTVSQRIPSHKFVLSIGSAVFDAMFNGGMATTSGEVELPDVEPAAFLALLKFLYSDEVQIGPETVMTTLYTAKKYAVPALERACVDFLKRNLSSDNAFMLLTQARLFDEPQLAALCLETIDKNTTEALSAEGFTDIDLDTLCVVLERDTLGIRECKLFSAVCRWAQAECNRQNLLPATSENQRKVLGRALHNIRFPLMTVEEFAMGAAQSGILHDREVVQLFLHYTVNPKPQVDFLDTPRCCLTGKEQVVSRFCQIESRWGYSGTSDRIRFMVNRRIFVVGFGLYGSIHGLAEYTVNIQIIHTDTGKVCGQNDSSFQCDGSNSTFRVMFKEPVEIQPNTNYTACGTLKGPDSYYGTKGLRKVTHESVTSGKVTFQFTYAAGNNNGTSVEDGQLPEIIFYT